MPQGFSPQDKKRASLERDGRNCYGENDKASRKAIRRRKRIVNRTLRRVTKQVLSETDAEPESLTEEVCEVKRIDWKKVPDKPLGDCLSDQLKWKAIRRILEASEPDALLDNLESQLLENDVPSLAVRDILRQLRGVVRSRWSTSFSHESPDAPLKLEHKLLELIIGILSRNQVKSSQVSE